MSRLALAVLIVGLLAACTGTREEALPTLLVVGSTGPGGSQLQLVEDVFDPQASPPRALLPVPGSERALPAPPVSLDVADRTGARSELVVLLGAADTWALHFFDLSGLDPNDPSTFDASRPPIDLDALLTGAEMPLCPVQVQIGGEAGDESRYVAVLDDGSCRSGTPEVFVIDLAPEGGGDAEHLYSLTIEYTGARPLPAGIFVEQSSGRLFYAMEDFGDTAVHSVPLAGGGVPQRLGVADFDLESAVLSDLASAADGIALLADGEIAVVPFVTGGGEPAEAVSTLTAGRLILPDPSGSMTGLVVFSTNRVAIHAGAEGDEDPEEYSLAAPPVDVTFEPVQRFGYLLEEDGVEILDLFPYAEAPGSRLLFRPLPDLGEPRVITWAFAVDASVTLP